MTLLTRKLYISYGSNLHKAHMRSRCPGARPVGKFLLTNARLVFRGVADVEYDPNSQVPCGLWEITRRDEEALDRYEGVSTGFYSKNEAIVLKYKGERRNALIYLMNSEGIYPPSEGYFATIAAGYRHFGLDRTYLDAALKHSFTKKAPDDQTEARRERQKRARERLVPMPEAVALKRLEARQRASLRLYGAVGEEGVQ